MRVKHSVIVQIGDDTEMKDKLFYTDETLAQTQSDGFTRAANTKVHVAQAGSESLSFGDVDVVKGFYLKVDVECIVRLNGSTDNIQLRKAGSASYAKLLMECDLTQIEVDAPADSAVNGVFVVWGDPSA
jgi:hypothetical protein